MKIALLPFLLLCAVIAHAQQKPPATKAQPAKAPPVTSDLVGAWKARLVIDETELAKQPQEFQKMMKTQLDKFEKKPWVLTLKKDGTYMLPLISGQSEEGVWASKELLLHVRVKKQSGKKAAIERLEKYAIAPDRKSFKMKLTPYLTVEYSRK